MATKSSTQSLSFSVDRLLQKTSTKRLPRKESSSSSGEDSSSSTPPHSPPLFRSTAPIMINTAGITALPFSLTQLSSPIGTSGGAPPSLAPASAWTMHGSPATFNSTPVTSWNTAVAIGHKLTPWTFSPATVGAFSHLQPAKGRHLTHHNLNRFSTEKISAITFPSAGQLITKSPMTAALSRPSPLATEDIGDDDGMDSDSCSSPSSPSADLGESSSPSCTTGSNKSETDLTHGGSGAGGAKRYKKKKRTTFSSTQLKQLETRFNQQKYLTKLDRCRMAQGLGLTEKHIKTWYQNRRTKWKRECTDEMWSRERETAAANMYTQHLQLKSALSSSNTSSQSSTTINNTVAISHPTAV